MPSGDEFDLAIVGMACRFPGARNLDEFWTNLSGGVESIARLSDDEILESGVPVSYLRNPNYVKAAPVLEDPGHFDAAFFGFTPAEARTLDPQHRILLELAHEALEHAGCNPARYAGRTGVFAGAALNTYFINVGLNSRLTEDYIPTLIGNDKDFLSTRISYKLNLKGPSLTVQTACSTSLVAIHLARQSLLSGETDMALVGAISVRVPHCAGYVCDGGGIVSPDGHVRAFDASANGTVFGSGGGILVLKRLADAVAEGDTVHAVIKGSAVNNDGTEKAGYSAPSVNGQADVVAEALANAGVHADSIGYVEAHGSGTPVGDPIEVRALTKAFRADTQRTGYCAIGSVKTNVGHLDATAGLAGVIKTVLALKHRQIPPTLHFREGNPEIDFPATPFYVNAHLQDWTGDGPRRAGVMSTGMGGTNAHIVLEEAPEPAASPKARAAHLLVLSAKTETALDQATHDLREFLDRNTSANLTDVASTLQVGRKAHSYRRYLVCGDREDAVAALGPDGAKRVSSGQVLDGRRPVVFLLPGIGDHYVGMAHGLYERWPAFRAAVAECAQLLEPHLGLDIRTVLYPDSRSWEHAAAGKGIDLKKMLRGRAAAPEDPDAARLNTTLYAQPALFTIEYAIARLWQSLGVAPDAIVCHSMGEYVAACLAGVFSLEDALHLIAARAKLVHALPQGAMLAVLLPEQELKPLLKAPLSISLINGPNLCVVAGPVAAVGEFEKLLAAREVISRHVQNAHAFHSRMLDPIVEAFEAEVRTVRLHEPSIRYTSNVTGTWITPREATDPAYWARHANHTARFSDALTALWQMEDPILLEAGPGRTLGVLAMQHPAKARDGNPMAAASVRHHYEHESDDAVLLRGIGQLWLGGAEIRWDELYAGEKRRRVPLPTYPFERREYWLTRHLPQAMQAGSGSAPRNSGVHPPAIDDWFYVPAWERTPPLADNGRGHSEGDTSWLLFTDRWGGGTGFRRMLEKQGSDVRVVRFGSAFRRRDDGSFEINPTDAGDYVKLFREIVGTATGPLAIVHLGCLTRDGEPTDDGSQDFGFFSLLHIAQAIDALNVSRPVRIGVISNRIHDVTGEETLDPEMATVLGPSAVIAREFPNVSCFNVDLPGPRNADDPTEEVIGRILSEFAAPTGGAVIAYRGRHRWQRKYRRVALHAVDAATPPRLRERGVYLITGGTGGLGLAFAKHLARTCQARIVLTRRTPFPDKAHWREFLGSKETSDADVVIIAELLEIERLGGDVDVRVAEVSDRAQMQRVIADTLERFQAIHGVFHAAGMVKPCLIKAMTRTMATSVLAPKVQGTKVLFDLLQETELDFLVLFSSMSSVTGPFAHGDYSGANWFLDAFAGYANARSRFQTLAINWPVWKETGIGAGVAYATQLEALLGVENLRAAMLERAIRTDDGTEAFTRALHSGFPQVIVSPENLDDLMDRSTSGPAAPGRRVGRVGAERTSAASGETTTEDQPTNDIETAVSRIWCEVFGHDHIGVHQQFSDVGGHSLIAMQIVSKIKSLYQIGFSLHEFFATPTISALSTEIERRILQEIESLSDEEAGRLVQMIEADEVP